MPKTGIDFDRITVTRLGPVTPGIDSFKNSKQEMVDHIQRDALRDQRLKISTTWVWVYDGRIALGYVSLAMYSIDRRDILHGRNEPAGKYPYRTIPSLLIGQIATHRDYECNGIGQSMVSWAVKEAFEYSKSVGCRVVALHPHEDVVEWYRRKLKFKHIKRGNGQDVMYFDLLKTP